MTVNHRVLVVDDYPDAADIACTLLGMLGHTCRAAKGGDEAIALARTFRPDVVILDLGLPDLSGYEVARALRRMSGDALYIAAITGWGAPDDYARALAAGFDQHVVKPANLTKLREIIARADARAVRHRPASP